MPIRPELRHFYRGPAYEATRARIKARAKNRCEQCGKRNHRAAWVVSAQDLYYSGVFAAMSLDNHFLRSQFWSGIKGDGQRWTSCTTGEKVRLRLNGMRWKMARHIRVICTLAHLNHVPGDDRDENLWWLCQWCHLNYDKLHHKETRRIRKDATRPLLGVGTAL